MPIRIINNRYVLSSANPRSGGMADVYKATDLHKEGYQVAVKIFKHGQIESGVQAESFRREKQILGELKHPNIIELFDSGEDQQTGEQFLVLEWIEKNLTDLLREDPLEGWDSYWEKLALPILKALAFSHERLCVHRDLKPNNILIGKDGRIKLADFGISKLRSYFSPTVTLREFVSRPYTPPEDDDGSYQYTRDVFSFGVLTLKCLTDIDLVDYKSVTTALNNFDAPPEIIEIIERSTATDPAERQQNVEVLLAELDSIQQKRLRSQPSSQDICYIKLTTSAKKNLQNELQLSEQEIEKILLEDLNAGCAIAKKTDSKSNDSSISNKYSIFGFSYRYLVAAEQDHLVIIDANSFSSAILEQNRERSWQSPYEFKFGRILVRWEAEEVIAELKLSIEEHEINIKQSKAEKEKERIFQVWWDILKAKTDWEQLREKSLKYTSFQSDGNQIIFQLAELPEENINGQSRCIKNSKGIRILVGDVVEVNGDELCIYIKSGNSDNVLQSGELFFDTQMAEIALNRQKSALDSIRYNRAVRSDLRNLIVNPEEVNSPILDTDVQFIQNLNESQKEVVRSALSMQDFLLVQGPPGTGKTTFITEVILQLLQQNPEARILLSSQTHVALDNALERIQEMNSNLKLIRIGNHERVSSSVTSLLLENQMENWRKNAVSHGEKFLSDWSAKNNISQQDLEKSILFQELKNTALNLDSLRIELHGRKQEREENFPFLDNFSNKSKQKTKKIKLDSLKLALEKQENLSTSNNLSGLQSQRNIPASKKEEFQYLEEEIELLEEKAKKLRDEQKIKAKRLQEISKIKLEELLKLSVDELEEKSKLLIDPNAPNAKLFQRLINLQTSWFEQFGRNDRFNSPLIKRSQVVAGTCIGIAREIQDIEFDLCIIDEASKATATEVLVPMSRSKKWLLVGDPKQLPPFQDEASRNSEFLAKYELAPEDIQETLFDRLLQTLPAECHKMLAIQHRMVKPIGNLISACFYDNHLGSSGPEIDKVLSKTLPKPVTWLTTSKLSNSREQTANLSFNNSCEVTVIFQWLKKLNQAASEAQKTYNVAILSGYAAQLKLLNRSLDAEQNSLPMLKIECNTVDAFQGREADIVIYSVTRSNKEGKLGFLRDEARLNVALSRGRIGLVIVGDHHFCRSLSYTPLHSVLQYIEQNPEGCICKEAHL